MMKAILGSAAGGAVAGAIALAASAQSPRVTEPAWSQPAVQPTGAYAMPVANAPVLRTALTNAPTLVDCEPGQRAVLQQTLIEGRELARVACVTEQLAPTMAYGAPVAYVDPRSSSQPDIVQQPAVQRVVTRPRATRVSSVQREVEPKRSWKKTALIIGGSTAGAAGVGGLIGGKKGALIGAGIGGGAATIYEAMKRK